jgi:3-oxoacyl-[acyl-carrier protein] reductase
VAVVSGGSCGVGRAVVRELTARAYAVVVVYLADQRQAEATVQEVLAADGTAVAVRADITDDLDVERLFNETVATFGGIDVLVHAAAGSGQVLYEHAARWLAHRGAILGLVRADPLPPGIARALRERQVTVGRADHDVAEALALLTRWRRSA